tara:strand:- start:351 stop:728 length:378 start_codon:yes stop_codon:yes gene_type:complete
MHKGKKHTESSYQPIKDKGGKVILTSEQARNVDEDFPSINENSHEFDHKPSQEDVKKADFINNKMKKMRKESQGRKAVKDVNKVINNIKKSPMNMLGMGVSRCWKGYKPNPDGRPASDKGSCVKA